MNDKINWSQFCDQLAEIGRDLVVFFGSGFAIVPEFMLTNPNAKGFDALSVLSIPPKIPPVEQPCYVLLNVFALIYAPP